MTMMTNLDSNTIILLISDFCETFVLVTYLGFLQFNWTVPIFRTSFANLNAGKVTLHYHLELHVSALQN